VRTLSKKSSYALQALLALSRRYGLGPVLIADLAEQERIPKKFLELLLLELKNAGILHSKKGKGGGYYLVKSPEEVTFGQVIRIFDGPLAPLPCATDRAYVKCDECEDASTCGVRVVMKEVRDVTARVLDGTTLASVAHRVEQLKKHKKPNFMYQI
jgi:Rrf2 family protein